jgi:hypothetical protein
MSVICNAVSNNVMFNHDLRKQLFDYLKSNSYKLRCDGRFACLKIVPVKPLTGTNTEFVSPNVEIYTSADSCSTNEYFLLDEKLLSRDDYYAIFGKAINEMNESMKIHRYCEMVISWLKESDTKALSIKLLNEFNCNYKMFKHCQDRLTYRHDYIPMKFCEGYFSIGNKYVNDSDYTFSGVIINQLCVDSSYNEFAKFLGRGSIFNIRYGGNDIDVEVDKLNAEDINDILNGGFKYRDEILKGFVNDNKVPHELIEKFNLERFITDKRKLEGYEFPSNPVGSLIEIKSDIDSVNLGNMEFKYVERREWPGGNDKKREFALSEYSGKCVGEHGHNFCQSCRKLVRQKYIKVNSIPSEVDYDCAWNQMQLCFCLECSKDFESLRKIYGVQFVSDLNKVNVEIKRCEPYVLTIGGDDKMNIYFTANHLARIQAIIMRMRRENNK